MRCTAGAAFGFTTETTGTLNESVCARSAACALSRGRIPTPRASSKITSGVKRSRRVCMDRVTFGISASIFGSTAFIFGSSAVMWLLSLIGGLGGHRGRMRLAALEPSVYRRKYDGHEQQCGHGSEQEPADHGAPEGCVLLAAV